MNKWIFKFILFMLPS